MRDSDLLSNPTWRWLAERDDVLSRRDKYHPPGDWRHAVSFAIVSTPLTAFFVCAEGPVGLALPIVVFLFVWAFIGRPPAYINRKAWHDEAKKATNGPANVLFVGQVSAHHNHEETLVAVRYISLRRAASNRTAMPKAVMLIRPFSVVREDGRAVAIESADIEIFSGFNEGYDGESRTWSDPPIEVHEGDTVALYGVGGAPVTSMVVGPATPIVLLKSWS